MWYSLTAWNADCLQRKGFWIHYLHYKIKIASNWITASSHPHFISPTKTVKMGKEIRQFNLSILKSTIYNHEMLRDSFLTPLRALPHSHMYPATSSSQRELWFCSIRSSLQQQIGPDVSLFSCGGLELESIYMGGKRSWVESIAVMHGKHVWCSLHRIVAPLNVYWADLFFFF